MNPKTMMVRLWTAMLAIRRFLLITSSRIQVKIYGIVAGF